MFITDSRNIKTLYLKEEYVFQPKAYIKYLISSCSSLEGLVQVFSEVVLEKRCLKTLSSILQNCPKTRKSTNSLE